MTCPSALWHHRQSVSRKLEKSQATARLLVFFSSYLVCCNAPSEIDRAEHTGLHLTHLDELWEDVLRQVLALLGEVRECRGEEGLESPGVGNRAADPAFELAVLSGLPRGAWGGRHVFCVLSVCSGCALCCVLPIPRQRRWVPLGSSTRERHRDGGRARGLCLGERRLSLCWCRAARSLLGRNGARGLGLCGEQQARAREVTTREIDRTDLAQT